MAKPRIFVSSTYYDLRHIRSNMEVFIADLGYEPVLFENGSIPFSHDLSLADSCYAEVKNCHILVLIIGGRYGAPAGEPGPQSLEEKERQYQIYNSVTKQEYLTAREQDIPIFIFVDKSVKAEYETFKSNRLNKTIAYAHVESVNVFKLLDDILEQKRNNYIREFDRFEDMSSWLREQWAGIFADMLTRKREDSALRSMAESLMQLGEVTKTMKEYTQSIMEKVAPAESVSLIDRAEKRSAEYLRGKFLRSEFAANVMVYTMLENGDESEDELIKAFEASSTLKDMYAKLGVNTNYSPGLVSPAEQKRYALMKLEFPGTSISSGSQSSI